MVQRGNRGECQMLHEMGDAGCGEGFVADADAENEGNVEPTWLLGPVDRYSVDGEGRGHGGVHPCGTRAREELGVQMLTRAAPPAESPRRNPRPAGTYASW